MTENILPWDAAYRDLLTSTKELAFKRFMESSYKDHNAHDTFIRAYINLQELNRRIAKATGA